jgi:hypothetical protein
MMEATISTVPEFGISARSCSDVAPTENVAVRQRNHESVAMSFDFMRRGRSLTPETLGPRSNAGCSRSFEMSGLIDCRRILELDYHQHRRFSANRAGEMTFMALRI